MDVDNVVYSKKGLMHKHFPTWEEDPLIELAHYLEKINIFTTKYSLKWETKPNLDKATYECHNDAFIRELNLVVTYQNLPVRIDIDIMMEGKYYIHYKHNIDVNYRYRDASNVPIGIPRRGCFDLKGVVSRILKIMETLQPALDKLSGKDKKDEIIKGKKDSFSTQLTQNLNISTTNKYYNSSYYIAQLSRNFQLSFSVCEPNEEELLNREVKTLVEKVQIRSIQIDGDFSISELKEFIELLKKNPKIILDRLG